MNVASSTTDRYRSQRMKTKTMKKGHPIAVRFDPDVEEAIKAVAAAEERSLPFVINRACRRAKEDGTLGVDRVTKRAKS